jgi:hypothetical protein
MRGSAQARLLTAAQAARHIGIKIHRFHRWRSDDKWPAVPRPVTVHGAQFYCRDELDRFVRTLVRDRGYGDAARTALQDSKGTLADARRELYDVVDAFRQFANDAGKLWHRGNRALGNLR